MQTHIPIHTFTQLYKPLPAHQHLTFATNLLPQLYSTSARADAHKHAEFGSEDQKNLGEGGGGGGEAFEDNTLCAGNAPFHLEVCV